MTVFSLSLWKSVHPDDVFLVINIFRHVYCICVIRHHSGAGYVVNLINRVVLSK